MDCKDSEVKSIIIEYCNSITLDEINFTIEQIKLNRDKPSKALVDHIHKIIKLLIVDGSLRLIKRTNIYRIRQDLSGSKLIREGLWFPENEKNCSQGRFNFKNQIMGYFADSVYTANLETKSDNNQHMHILHCIVKENDLKIGYVPILNEKLNRIQENKQNEISKKSSLSIINELSSEQIEKITRVTTFIGNEMVKRTNNYWITNIIGNLLFSFFKLDVLIYPSVKSDLLSNNLVFSPESANKYIQLVRSEGVGENKWFDFMIYAPRNSEEETPKIMQHIISSK